jgi:hypothetical protein
MKSLQDYANQSTVKNSPGHLIRTIGVDDNQGFFAFSRIADISVFPQESTTAETGDVGRCDAANIGPYGFHSWDANAGVCNCGLTTPPDPAMGHHILLISNIMHTHVVLNCAPYGYVLYFECVSQDIEEQCCSLRHSESARTLQELFKLIIEWDEAYVYFDNREPVSIAAHGILQLLNMPSALRSWVEQNVPDQLVEKFLKGDPLARARNSNVPDMTPEFDDWITTKIEESLPLGYNAPRESIPLGQ